MTVVDYARAGAAWLTLSSVMQVLIYLPPDLITLM